MLQSLLKLCFNTFKTYIQPNKLNLRYIIINFILLFLIGLVTYFVFSIKSYNDFILIFIGSIILYFFNSYVGARFKFSNNLVIRLLQKLLLNFVIFFICVTTLSFFKVFLMSDIFCLGDDNTDVEDNTSNQGENISKDQSAENTDKKEVYSTIHVTSSNINKALDAVATISENVAGNWGAATVAATVGAPAGREVVRQTVHAGPVAKYVALGAATAAASAGFISGAHLGRSMGQAMVQNADITNMVKISEHANPAPDRIPSPDTNMINSALELGDLKTPLGEILNSLLLLNNIELILILFLLYLLCFNYIQSIVIKIISILINKYLPSKSNRFNKYLEKGNNYNTKSQIATGVVILLVLIVLKLMNIYFTGEISIKLDDYVLVYNYIKKIS